MIGSLGVVMLLGGIGHSLGVLRFYIINGVPDADRVLLDTWVAESHLLGGCLYMAALRGMRAGKVWKGLSIAGAVTTLAYVVPFLPVLFDRAPVVFRIPPTLYAALSAYIIVGTAISSATPRPEVKPRRRFIISMQRRALRAAVDAGLGRTGSL